MNPVQQPIVQSAIRLISAGGVASFLAPMGFKRQGVHFWREANGLTQAVHFQASRWGTKTDGSFTINLGVSSPLLYSTFTGKEPPKNPATTLSGPSTCESVTSHLRTWTVGGKYRAPMTFHRRRQK